jgi:hypothetical protein
MYARIAHLDVEIARSDEICERLYERLTAVRFYRATTPSALKGWPAEVVTVVTLFAFVAELFTMTQLAKMVDSLDGGERFTFAAVLSVCAFGTGVVLGEILYHRKIEKSDDVWQRVSFVAVAVIAAVILVVEWIQHFMRTQQRQPLHSGLDATTLGIVGLVVLVIPVVVSYHREAWSTATARWREFRLDRKLKAEEARYDRAYYERLELNGELRLTTEGSDRDEASDGN